MPATVNGIGSQWCGYWAPIRWEKGGALSRSADHDCMVCFVIFFLPILPLQAVHTFGWEGDRCIQTPIRWSMTLILNALVRPYLLAAAIGIPIVLSLYAFASWEEIRRGRFEFASLGIPAGIAVGAAVLLVLLGRLDRKSRDIRLIIGPHEAGSSDPATWSPALAADTLEKIRIGGESVDEESVREMMRQGRPARAMWLARIAAGNGEPWGKNMTEEFLQDSTIAAILFTIRKAPWLREQAFSEAYPSPPPTENPPAIPQ